MKCKKSEGEMEFVGIALERQTHNISSVGKPVNASVGTRCSIFPSRRSARRLFSWAKEISSKCISALSSSCLAYDFFGRSTQEEIYNGKKISE